MLGKMKAKEQSNDLFFVEVRDPAEVRRNILETLRQILSVLQRFEKFKGIRDEKLQKIQKLRILVREANRIANELKSRMPQTNLRAAAVKETKHIQRVSRHSHKKKEREAKEAKPEKQPKPKKLTELERLESELSAIEGKLKTLA